MAIDPNSQNTNERPMRSKKLSQNNKKPLPLVLRLLGWLFGLTLAGLLAGVAVIAVVVGTIYPKLPDVSDLADYRPKLPLRIFSQEGALIGEFGEERRKFIPIAQIPEAMKHAILAAEDNRFYEHSGVDLRGAARAALANFRNWSSQGASTITMQVARNMYLSAEQTISRKVYEILLTYKMEQMLSKDEILEIYMNQIFLGNRAYGFAAASETYFGKPLESINTAEAAMLAGIPIAPSKYNPIRRFERARIRQLHIINRMQELGFINAEQAQAARDEKINIRSSLNQFPIKADYVAEMTRQAMVERFGPEAYTRGLNVYTTIQGSNQQAAYSALRAGIMRYENTQKYRGPEGFIDLPESASEREDAIDAALTKHPDNGNLLAAVVLQASPKKVIVGRVNGEHIEITGAGLKPVESGLSEKAAAEVKIRPGAIVRLMQDEKNNWKLTHAPKAEGALIAMDPNTGAIRSLVGGFDFNKNKFNHVTQAWRQPGSSFKPFIYSAVLEYGYMPSTVIADTPLHFTAHQTGNKSWSPKNFGGGFAGPISMIDALSKSKNIVTVRLLDAITPQKGKDWALRFGFDDKRMTPVLPMALGSNEATPLQMARAFSVFANGGYLVDPWIIQRVTDARGKTLIETTPTTLEQRPRSISARNAFIIKTMLRGVMQKGTGSSAQKALKRADIYGKTGTTNDSKDIWFAGFQPSLTAVTWMGYGNSKTLGRNATGGGLALPIWTSFMQSALQYIPVESLKTPAGVIRDSQDNWAYTEFANAKGIANLGLEDLLLWDAGPDISGAAPTQQERDSILDLFRD